MKNSSSRLDASKKKSTSSNTSTGKKSSIIYKSIYLNIENLIDKYNKKQKSKEKHPTQLSREPSRDSTQHRYSKGSVCLSKPGTSMQIDNFIRQPSNDDLAYQQPLSKNTFIYHYIVGKGGFGKVWKVESKKTRQFFALKEMLKSLVMAKKSIQSVLNEKTLLAKIHSPFLVNMHYAFQDREVLYLVMDLMPGGDLRYHIGMRSKFSEIQAKFFIACIIIGLEYLHGQNIIHRDIKPENLVLDSKGYIRITDLGIARVYRQQNSSDTSGTPGYMSPEVICRQDHSFVSDYFALGVIAYQLMLGKRPYSGKTRKDIRDQILARQAQVKKNQIPDYWSSEAADFVNKLIHRKPQNRLGFKGIQQIKDHPWIRQLNWAKLSNKQIQSPFVPAMKKDNFDQDQQITLDDQQQAVLIQKNNLLLRKNQYQDFFKGYFYDKSKQSLTGDVKKILTTASCSDQQHRKLDISVLKPNQRSITCTNITQLSEPPTKQFNRTNKDNLQSLQTAIKMSCCIPTIEKHRDKSRGHNQKTTLKQYFPARR